MAIAFPTVEAWDGNRDVVWFPANVDGQQIRCAISWEALQDHFGGESTQPIEAFRKNRARIEAVAERLIIRQQMEQDGSILVRTRDC